MPGPIDARCVKCGATFPREEATVDGPNDLACPVCDASVVGGVPEQYHSGHAYANAVCRACGSTFPRSKAETDIKGVLACPVCGSTSDIRVEDTEES